MTNNTNVNELNRGKNKNIEANSNIKTNNTPSRESSYEVKCTSGTSQSPWLSEQLTTINPLRIDSQCEICIIGAGIAGLSIAYELSQLGKKVIVLEAGLIGSGETGRTTAHLSNAFDDRYFQIISLHGKNAAKLVADSHSKAIDYFENIIKKEKIDCDFIRLNGYLFLAPNDNINTLKKELNATIQAGLKNVELISNSNLRGFKDQPVLMFPNQAHFHTLKYLNGLVKAITEKGVEIYTNTQAIEIIPNKKILIKTNTNVSITAHKLVIATNAPIFDKSSCFSKQISNRSYAVAISIPLNSVELALFWDTENPYHYVRLHPLNKKEGLLIIGGEDHRTGQCPLKQKDPFSNLLTWAKRHFLEIKAPSFQWSGQIQEPTDYFAYIGMLPTEEKNLFIVTGDSGNGMTHGVIAGLLISDLIMGKQNPWEKIYDPRRSRFKNFIKMLNHNLKSLGSFTDYFTPGEISSIEEIKPGQGAILRNGVKKLAIYRDEQGNLYEHPAICTHMKAPLKWNELEKTWDCPAHGSRFSICGNVLQGPAKRSLDDK